MLELSEVLPHRGPMLLLDKIASYDGVSLVAEATITENSTFFRPQSDPPAAGAPGVPSWVGIEYMAQAVAAWSGVRERESGGAPKVGFLLGVKKYGATQPVFALGSRLKIEVRATDKHGSLGVFECRIDSPDAAAQGVITVYEGEPPGGAEKEETE